MILNQSNLSAINKEKVSAPEASHFNLPEKILQFGTGVLLRGLPDYFVDKANKQGVFNGRIVIVKSTDQGDTKDFDQQDSLYTICIKGIENGNAVEKNVISSAISRVLTAGKHWDEILKIASSPDLEIVISNTTEVGITLVEEDLQAKPPLSFPGKLLVLLLKRFTVFNGAADKGLVIVPTELIVDNGNKLKEIMLTLAEKHKLPPAFITWMLQHNTFCSSLVDCIVPGKPDATQQKEIQADLGYEDDLVIITEVYRLWAISGDEKVRQTLSFAQFDEGVVITPDINLHRELKLRLLNGTHTLSCGLAHLLGFDTVKSAMEDPIIESYIAKLMRTEIAPAIPYKVNQSEADDFSMKVLDRFRNPYLNHQWLSITLNYSSKLKLRILPVLTNYVDTFKTVPELIALGFAAYIRFMKPAFAKDYKHFGEKDGRKYLINDIMAPNLAVLWEMNNESTIVKAVLNDTLLWGSELTKIKGFEEAVNKYFKLINQPAETAKSNLKELIS